MRRLPLAMLPCVLLAAPAAAQSQAEALRNGQAPEPSDQLVSNATLAAMNQSAEDAIARQLDLETRADIEARRDAYRRDDRGWWRRLWDAILGFDGPTLWRLLVQPVPLIVLLGAILLLVWAGRRRR